MTSDQRALESTLRDAMPHVVAALTRRYGDFDWAEDAAQEALVAAFRQWPREGVPSDPQAWLIRVASRRLVDGWRSDSARRDREQRDALRHEATTRTASTPTAQDDSLTLILLCCHPALTRAAQVPLTLRAVGGLTTAQIARLLLASESTVAQRISRAKARLREAGATFEPPEDVEARMPAVLQVLYLVFTEGHTPTTDEGAESAATEAVRLARMLRELRPADGEVAGLLALLLLTRSRHAARGSTELVPLREQDRSRWDTAAIDEGVALLEESLPRGPAGPYAIQAAIAAVHAEAATWEDTDWVQILALYDLLARVDPSPVVRLNRAVAVAMVDGAAAGLQEVEVVADSPALRHGHRVDAVRAHLWEMAGDMESARAGYARAAERTEHALERDYLLHRAAALAAGTTPP